MAHEWRSLSTFEHAATRTREVGLRFIGVLALSLVACGGNDDSSDSQVSGADASASEFAAMDVEAIGLPTEQAQAAAEAALADPRVAELLHDHDVTAVRVTPVPRAHFSNMEGNELPATDDEYVFVDAAITPAFGDREFQESASTETSGGVCGTAPEEPAAFTGLAWSVELAGFRISALTPTWADGAGDCFDR